jgi:hypothetical protein
MELQAVIAGLSALKEPCAIRVVTDSQYVQRGMAHHLKVWAARGWKTPEAFQLQTEACGKRCSARAAATKSPGPGCAATGRVRSRIGATNLRRPPPEVCWPLPKPDTSIYRGVERTRLTPPWARPSHTRTPPPINPSGGCWLGTERSQEGVVRLDHH